jgi:hypothetical protein
MDTIWNGYNMKWIQYEMDTIWNRYNMKWMQYEMDTIWNGYNKTNFKTVGKKKRNNLPCVGGRYRRGYPGWQNGNGSTPSTNGTSGSPTKHRVVVTGTILFLAQGSFHVAVANGTGLKHGPNDNRYFTSMVRYIVLLTWDTQLFYRQQKNMDGHKSKHFYSLRWPMGIFHNSSSKGVQICWSQQFLET